MVRCPTRLLSIVSAATLLSACAAPQPSQPALANPAPTPELVTVPYPVQDLVHAQGPDAEPFMSIADLAQNMKDATDASYWEGEGTAIRLDETDVIAVTASQPMQQRVVTFLGDVRRFARKQ
jgi:hypothetical protein